MCGISGLYRPGAEVSEDEIGAMCRRLVHRGPDETGTHIDGDFGFGIRRLSIVDLESGSQPIFNEDRSVAVICNGEIYNAPQLRQELAQRGHRFSSRSDVEPIVHLYEEHGTDFARHLRGMFAVAIWDARLRRLVLARDRLGIKPLHCWQGPGLFAFASEIKALLQLEGCPRDIDLEALDAYLSFNYILAPRTIFQAIRKVPPATTVVVDSGGVLFDRYWKLELPETRRGAEAGSELLELLRETVRMHLLSDVPVGVFLSGGIDSSLILALMSESLPRVKSFSIGFAEASYDEVPVARATAERFGTEHHELVVEPSHGLEVEKLVAGLDEPFGDLSALPVYFLSQMAGRQVKVVLSGDGGDELFAGYMTYVADRLARYYRWIPRSLRQHLIPWIVSKLPTSFEKVSFDYKAKRFVEMAGDGPLRSHLGWKVIFSEAEKEGLYRPGLREALSESDPWEPYVQIFEYNGGLHWLDRLLRLDLSTYLVDDILTKVDRMSMAHSLEVRVPLLDHRVVEFAARLRPNLKLKGLRTKHLLKEICRGLLPDDLLNRKKSGFIFPASLWLQRGLREFTADVLSPASLDRMGYFDSGYVQQLLQQHWSGVRDQARPIWNLVMFSSWYSQFMDRSRGGENQ